MIGKRQEYEAMARCERELWWYRCLHELTLAKIAKAGVSKNAAILDAGCGTGGLLSVLKQAGYNCLQGFDLSEDALEFAASICTCPLLRVDITRAPQCYPDSKFDVIISHDIICLLDEAQEKQAFASLLQLLKPGGILLMNLPAGRVFGGTHDRAVGIMRRYSRDSIRQLATGLSIEFSFWPFLLSPLIFLFRSVQRMRLMVTPASSFESDVKLPAPWLNRLFYRLTRWELKRLQGGLWGSSLFVVIRPEGMSVV